MPSFVLKVEGMTCGHCKGKVEDALKGVAGTYTVMVDLEDGVAEVDTSAADVGIEDFIAAVQQAGYRAAPEA